MTASERTKERIVYYAPHFNGYHIRTGSYTACGQKVGPGWVETNREEAEKHLRVCLMCRSAWWHLP